MGYSYEKTTAIADSELFIAGITQTTCLAGEPLRVAILPIFNSSYTYDKDTEQVITKALKTRFSMPLSKVIVLYDVIAESEIKAALPTELKNRNKPGKINAALLREIAVKLQADVVIGAHITNFRIFTSRTLDDDLLLQTDLSIRIVGYDTKKEAFLDIHDREHYNGQWSVIGTPDYLAKQLMDELMNKIPYTWHH